MHASASGGDVTINFRRCLNSESFRQNPLRILILLLSLQAGRITGYAEERPANVTPRARSAFVKLGRCSEFLTRPNFQFIIKHQARELAVRIMLILIVENQRKQTIMKRNVSIKVFATKAGDITDRAEKPVFRRERYQVDEEEIDLVSLKNAVDFLWDALNPVLVLEIF